MSVYSDPHVYLKPKVIWLRGYWLDKNYSKQRVHVILHIEILVMF